jgi:hypothetical protein
VDEASLQADPFQTAVEKKVLLVSAAISAQGKRMLTITVSNGVGTKILPVVELIASPVLVIFRSGRISRAMEMDAATIESAKLPPHTCARPSQRPVEEVFRVPWALSC